MKRMIVIAFVLGLAVGLAAPAYAVWTLNGSGTAGSLADIMPKGNQPTATKSGTTVTVSWTTAKLTSGTAVAGYIVSRYNATTHAQATVAGTCAGVVTTTSCSETSVPSGSWVYTDRPVQNNWNGAESNNSATVTLP